jgi:uncharacterized membrane protein
MPARTAKGTAMTRRVNGFRIVIEKAEEHMSKWAEQENVFTRLLPYAVVFGVTDKWAKAFESLGSCRATRPGTSAAARSSTRSSPTASTRSRSRRAERSRRRRRGRAGSGFSGGGAGGGGGGGGGGSW